MKKIIIASFLRTYLPFLVLTAGFFPVYALANQEAGGGHAAAIAETFLWMAVLFLVSKLGALTEKVGQPAVLGEIVMGVILGNLTLLGIHTFDPMATNEYLKFLAEFGVVILLFRIGLESNIKEMSKVGLQALMVATIGVILPFLFGTGIVGYWFYPESDFGTKLFIGAALTATSVGITARVFQDLGKLQMKEAKIVLGAAVIDDIMGLLILAIVSSIAQSGSLSGGEVALLSLKAIGFLAGAIIVGQLTASHIGKTLSKIHTGVGMKMAFAMSFALLFAYLAALAGLAPIVGAFAAGLVLDPVHFHAFKSPEYVAKIKEKLDPLGESAKEALHVLKHYEDKHVEDLIDNIGYVFIPLFFVITGLQVKLDVLFDPKVLLTALLVTALAFAGKILAGLGTWGGVRKLLVGVGMIPRGEVGLIFVNVGKAMGFVSDEIFSVIVVMVIFSTLLTPPFLTILLKRLTTEPTHI